MSGKPAALLASRRTATSAVVAAALAATAGCSSLGDRAGPDRDTASPTGTPEPTDTPEPQPSLEIARNGTIAIEYSRDIDDVEEVPNQHASFLAVDPDSYGLDELALVLENGEETRVETDVRDQMRVTALELGEGENEAYLAEYEDGKEPGDYTTADAVTDTQTITKNAPAGYRTQLVDPAGETLNSWETVYSFDDQVFDQSALNDLRHNWNQEAAFDGFVEKVEADDDFKGRVYPNWSEENGEYNYGHFDLESFKQSTDFPEILDWITTAARTQTAREYDGPPSGHANHMAASAELAIDDVHPEANTRGWGVFNGGHGTMMFYDESGDSGYWHVDTTSENIVKPAEAQAHREDVWSPFRSPDSDQPGFHLGAWQDKPDVYVDRKQTSQFALLGMVLSGEPEEHNADKLMVTDEWLDEAYTHIRNDGEIEPVLEPLEEAVYSQVESGDYLGIYGSSLDDTRMAQGDLDGLYTEVMENPDPVSTEEVESWLEGAA